MKFQFWSVITILFFGINTLSAQAPENWFNLDADADNVQGVSTEKAYTLLSGKTSETVVVAVIDSGIDIEHEDLKDVIWVNEDEIPNNGIDDDNNGYIDDIHGWNFIGGKDGKHVAHDTYELTRLYAKYKKLFDGKSASSLSGKDKKLFAKYQELEKKYNGKKGELEEQRNQFTMVGQMFSNSLSSIREHLGKEDVEAADLETIDTGKNPDLAQPVGMLKMILGQGTTIAAVEEELEGANSYFSDALDYHLNTDFDPRDIVGDNYNNPLEIGYGNNDVYGPEAEHGTHVAGIIGANRTNDIGIKGVAANVKIMVIRAVPNGDERDKDVANAIRYAVDNGAWVVNMSFGKSYSSHESVVDAAIKHAMKNDVLLVHAAGNSSENIDELPGYPNDGINKSNKKKAKNYLTIGALDWKGGENSAASFSNFAKDNVDIFAPGVDINSTVPESKYKPNSGTSMASPVVAGVSALIMSYYPDLSAAQVKEIIMDSAVSLNSLSVTKPGTTDKVNFSSLCQTGGVINAYKAIQLASKTKGKRKTSKIIRP